MQVCNFSDGGFSAYFGKSYAFSFKVMKFVCFESF